MSTQALEIDEKLTFRIVNTSVSKKTMLINRGIEDGIVKGDHAKFYQTVGVVARGVVIKVSPTRSVWSIYRLVNNDYIKADQVMKLKITAPVKITKDESKMLVSDDTIGSRMRDPRDLGIQLADGADDLDGEVAKLDVKKLDWENTITTTSIKDKNKEIFVTLHYSSLSATTSPDDSSGDFSGTDGSMILNIGGELYFKNQNKWYSSFSLLGVFSLTNTSVMSHEGSAVTESTSEFGGGANWHPFTKTSRAYKVIPYGNFTFLMGSTETAYDPGSENPSGTSISLNGATTAYSFGGGLKFYTHQGYGARIQFDFYNRGDTFAADTNNKTWIKSKSGPRINMGISYRW